MLVTTTHELFRAVATLARQVDEILVESAARNAACAVAERRARLLDDSRTMRDLARIGLAEAPVHLRR